MYWVGMTTQPEADPSSVAEFNTFYSRTHLPEVLAQNPGFARATRYELIAQDPRGKLGPGWLATYEIDSEAATQQYIERSDGPADCRPRYTPGPRAFVEADRDWRMIWRRLTAAGEASQAPYAIYLIGMNVPPDIDAAGLAEFNAFYTEVHVPDVITRNGFKRGTRYELYRGYHHPAPGCPRFLALYEMDEPATTTLMERRRGIQPPISGYTEGPPAWQRHDTLWRLVYRRLTGPEAA